MDLTMLLMTTSIFAGVHMMLFMGAATIALIYYRRYKKLKREVAQDHEACCEEERTQRAANAGTTAANSARARGERRQRRRREEFRRQVTEANSDLDDVTSHAHDSGTVNSRPTTTREPKRDAEGNQGEQGIRKDEDCV